jgi:hypothetical protein
LYSQLRETPVLLIGAFNNRWTLKTTANLRFRFRGPLTSTATYIIEDTQNGSFQGWRVDAQASRSDVTTDYAIIARYRDESTNQIVMIAAGLAGSGTKAAAEFLTDEQSLEALGTGAPVGWQDRNFEAVLASQVTDGMQAQPKIVAKTFW